MPKFWARSYNKLSGSVCSLAYVCYVGAPKLLAMFKPNGSCSRTGSRSSARMCGETRKLKTQSFEVYNFYCIQTRTACRPKNNYYIKNVICTYLRFTLLFFSFFLMFNGGSPQCKCIRLHDRPFHTSWQKRDSIRVWGISATAMWVFTLISAPPWKNIDRGVC